MIRLDRALLLCAFAALGCAEAPLPLRASMPIIAATPSPPIVAPATIASITAAPREPAPAPIDRAAFPAGWVRGPLTPLDARAPAGSLTLDPQRPTVAPEVLRLADLPVIEVTPRPVNTKRPSSDTEAPGVPSQEIFVAPGCSRASVRNHAFGFIQVGWVALPIAPQSGGGVMLGYMKGGDGHDRYTLASWQTIDRTPDGALRLQETNAWFDMLTCKTYEVRRMEAPARPIAGGLAYVFRTRCPTCKASEVDRLHVLTPSGGWEQDVFTHHEIPLGPGASSTTVSSFDPSAIRRFHEAGASTERTTATTLGIDIVQGLGEPEPTAVVYTSDPPPSRF